EIYQRWRQAQDEFVTLKTQAEQRAAREELLRYHVQELDQLALQSDELVNLDHEQRQLANVGQLLEISQQALDLLAENNETNSLTILNTIQTQLNTLQNIDNSFTNINELVNNAIIQIQEASNELRHYLDRVEANPQRLEEVEQRLSTIHDLARKHRITPAELLNLQQQLHAELKQLETSDAQLKQLQQEIDQLVVHYKKTAAELTQSRQQAVKRLTPLIEASMQELGMQGGRFTIQFEPLEQFSPYGAERIEFYVSANPGQP